MDDLIELMFGDNEALKKLLPEGDTKVYTRSVIGDRTESPLRVAVATTDGIISAISLQFTITRPGQHLDTYTVETTDPQAIRRICADPFAFGHFFNDPEPMDEGASLADKLLECLNSRGDETYIKRLDKYLKSANVNYKYRYKQLSSETIYRSVNDFDGLNDTKARFRYRHDGSLCDITIEDKKYDPSVSLTKIKCRSIEITDPASLSALQHTVQLPDGLLQACGDDKDLAFSRLCGLLDDLDLKYKFTAWEGQAPEQTYRRTISKHLDGSPYHYTEGEVYVLVQSVGARITAASVSRSEGEGGRELSAGYTSVTAIDSADIGPLCRALHISVTDGNALAETLAQKFVNEKDFARFLAAHRIAHTTR